MNSPDNSRCPPLTVVFLATGLLGALAGCASSAKHPTGPEATPTAAQGTAATGHAPNTGRGRPLLRETAALRSKQISHVSYVLWFGLDESHEDFQGRAVISFELREKARELGPELALDFEGGQLLSFKLNGELDPSKGAERHDGQQIKLKLSELRTGQNRLEITFIHRFSRTGSGFHRFKDPSDNEVYVYTNLEPFGAHRVFPCFDQPDIKASFEVTVEAPEAWEVAANTMERETSKVDGRRSWAFPPSPMLSTYVFALIAGPFEMWKSDADGIPLRLFARKSLARHVAPDSREWFEITRKGIQHFASEFGYPFPFSKYDQLVVPEFNSGAMENAAAVTFSESMVFRSKVTSDRRRNRADTILHELAHMWFGDLVTMRWWNGLWLNESFATFQAAKALDEAMEYKDSWQTFFSRMKEWAYWEDQLVTTHPIDVSVLDTDQAFSNFDGITYGKGAAVLKQLGFLLGEEDFREGLQRYFQKFAYRNTSLADFVRMLGEASSQNLSEWQKAWLQAPGLNAVEADWACDSGANPKISRFTLKQVTPLGGVLRTHRTRIALFSGRAKPELVDIDYSGPETPVAAAIGKPCPQFVFPNYDDYDYVKVSLDPVSTDAAQSRLSKLDDALTRQMVWHSLWEMVVDGKLSPQKFVEIALAQLGAERSTTILRKVLRQTYSSSNGHSAIRFLADRLREEYRDRFEEFTRTQLNKASAGSDAQLIWFEAYLSAASRPKSLEYLQGVLSGAIKLKGLKIEQERRWEIIQTLARASSPQETSVVNSKWVGQLIRDELKRDATDLGERESVAALARIPDPQVKQEWFAKVAFDPGPYSHATLKEAMGAFHLLGQEELSRRFVDPYFERLPAIAEKEDEDYSQEFAEEMLPSLCEFQLAQRIEQFLKAHDKLPAAVSRALRIHKQEEERCVRARTLSEGTQLTPG